MLGVLVAMTAASATPSPAPTPDLVAVREISQLERKWGEAFVKRDFAFIERIIAPEYRLALTSNDGVVTLVDRATWMHNTRAWDHRSFELQIVNVTTASAIAVATIQGLWNVRMDDGLPAHTIRFVATDTWVKRDGRWQVIWRYSQRLEQAAWPPVTKAEKPGSAAFKVR